MPSPVAVTLKVTPVPGHALGLIGSTVIMDDYEESAYFSDKEFAVHVERWFTEHFKTKDARLHKHLG